MFIVLAIALIAVYALLETRAGLARQRRLDWILVRISGRLACGYLVWCAMLYWLQDRLLFPRHMVATPVGGPPKFVEQLATPTAAGEVPAWLVYPAGQPSAAGSPALPLMVFFHGNAELIDSCARSPVTGFFLQQGYAVLLPEYRGYGRAPGDPAQDAIVADAVAVIEAVARRPSIDAGRIVYYGRSVGGGVACAVSQKRGPAALVLQSPFTSVASFASRYLAPALLVRHPFRNDEVLPTLDIPVLIAHGARDHIVPAAQGRALAELARHATYYEQDCGHNDWPEDQRAYEEALERFLRDNGLIERCSTPGRKSRG